MKQLYLFILIVVCCLACARPTGRLSGGEKDIQAPQILPISTANNLLNYKGDPIILHFDEFFTLKSQSQIIISPVLDKKPSYTIKKKSLIIQFDSETQLQDSTTYIINFGNSIVDFNEGNPLENFKFVLSTGPYLDSLSIQGNVIQADGSPYEKTLIAAYNSYHDTSLAKEIPAYISYTNEEGFFQLNQLPAGNYHIFAFQDRNNNLKYDFPLEDIAFSHENPIGLFPDSNDRRHILIGSKENQGFFDSKFLRLDEFKYVLVQSQDYKNLRMDLGSVFYQTIKEDSLFFYSDAEPTQAIIWNEDYADTIFVDSTHRNFMRPPLFLKNVGSSGIRTPVNQKCTLEFSNPIKKLNFDSIVVIVDSIGNTVSIKAEIKDSIGPYLLLSAPWKQAQQLDFTLDSASIIDIYDQPVDTASVRLYITRESQISSLTTNLSRLDSSKSYIFRLMLKDQILQEKYTRNHKKIELNWGSLVVNQYSLVIIEDSNGNGIQDPVHINKHRIPESIQIERIENLRAGWAVELDIAWKNKLNN